MILTVQCLISAFKLIKLALQYLSAEKLDPP